tara:strand:+ start:431 stop:1465 length:1035 start_codon:yes stop_codon:yes gene_type:complete
MSRARTFADLATASEEGSLASPNLLINGDMAISQRATSLSGQTGTSIRCVDRFNIVEGADAAFDVAQSSTAPDGFNNSLKIDTATADSSLASTQYASVYQRLEGLDVQQLLFGTSSAKFVTLSFYVRSNVTGTYSVTMSLADASSGYQSQTYSISSANTWEKKTITFIGDTTTAIPDDNTNAFAIDWCLGSGTGYTSGGATGQAWSNDVTKYFGGHAVNIMSSTDNEWLLTGVQLEIGEVATPFKYESHEYNLQRCQRYYEEGYIGFGGNFTHATHYQFHQHGFNTPKRTDDGYTMTLTVDNEYSITTFNTVYRRDFSGVGIVAYGAAGYNRYLVSFVCEDEVN